MTNNKSVPPLVSIGVTCFNAADTILRAVRSALAQDWPNFELVIVDDFSTDGSVPEILSATADHFRAKLIRHDRNLGPAAARNTILSHARGEFIAFFDDDDESLPNRVATQVKTLIKHEKRTGIRLVACYASGIRCYPNGYIITLPAIGSRGTPVPTGPAVADYLLTYRRQPELFYGSGTPTCSLLARRSTLAAVGGFDPELRRLEDADFAIRLALMGGSFVGVPETLFVQYSTRGPDKSPEQSLEAHQRLTSKHRAHLEAVGRFEYARRWPKLRYWHFKRRYGRFLIEFAGLLLRHPLAATSQLLITGPRRVLHEVRMRRRR